MKNKLFFLSVLCLLTLNSCKNEKMTCIITSPKADAIFSEYQSIPITVEASTTKGSIIQVQIVVDDEVIESLTKPPYNFTIPSGTIPVGMHILSAEAFSSGGNSEVAAIYITIE